MPKKHNRYFLKEKEAKKFLIDISQKLGIKIEQLLGSKTAVEVNETEIADIFFLDGRPLLARSDDLLFPTLFFEELFSVLPKVFVDMGAIPYVCKGADVMAPGLRAVKGAFRENELLLVLDERYGKPIAVGVSLFNSEGMKALVSGKIIKNLHYVGDKLWDYLKTP
jgi:PUA domain protein